MRFLQLFVWMLVFNAALGQTKKSDPVLVIHGGAGTILKSQMSPEKEKAYKESLQRALDKGYSILENGGTALDAVEATVRVLEDDPLFNAGRGAVFTNEGKNELDASIMDGKTLMAGSVAGVTTIRNPITAARAVMEKSEHVMMVGKGAELFAASQGLQLVDPSYFYTEDRFRGLQNARKRDSLKTELDHSAPKQEGKQSPKQAHLQNSNEAQLQILKHETNQFPIVGLKQPSNRDEKYGTVGAVALDKNGNLAAATSTGGMTNKKFGRVGDAPIIGAGTYSNNATCAISATGWGEYFIRLVMAKTISDMMEFGKMSLKDASNEMVMKRLGALGGDGGLIALDKDGNFSMPFNTEGMYRGWKKAGKSEVLIYKGE
ncbi:MAG: isoaspartyl peptidase/L-asparaginase family protein [Flavitalea sp.]